MAQGFEIAVILLYIVLILGSLAAAVLFIIAIWRTMKAHESIAASMQLMTKDYDGNKTEE